MTEFNESGGISEQAGEDNASVPVLLLTTKQAARALNVCERTLWGLTRAGEILRVKVGRLVRYRWSDLQRWVDRLQGNSDLD